VIPEAAETVIRDSSGRVLDRWVESDDNDPCCEECLAWATGTDVDEQTKQHALQDAINAAHERQQWAQQGVFMRKRDECPPRMEGDKPHCPDCSGVVGETGIVW
jgi:hypothetical protein